MSPKSNQSYGAPGIDIMGQDFITSSNYQSNTYSMTIYQLQTSSMIITRWYSINRISVNPLKCSGIRRLHLQLFSAIQL